jgi:hypothetical protein
VFKYEKQVEALKVALFRQEEIRNADEIQLLNTLFKSLDRTMSTRLNAEDIESFVVSRFPNIEYSRESYLRQVWLYGGQAERRLNQMSGDNHFKRVGSNFEFINFADFLMMVWPRHRFQLSERFLFRNKFPVYELKY